MQRIKETVHRDSRQLDSYRTDAKEIRFLAVERTKKKRDREPDMSDVSREELTDICALLDVKGKK